LPTASSFLITSLSGWGGGGMHMAGGGCTGGGGRRDARASCASPLGTPLPGSYFWLLRNNFFELKYLNSLMRIRDSDLGFGIRDWKNGSGIRDKHPDPQNCKMLQKWFLQNLLCYMHITTLQIQRLKIVWIVSDRPQRCGTVAIFYGSGSYFWKVMVPVPLVKKLRLLRFRFHNAA
jgi:hypothetical protein